MLRKYHVRAYAALSAAICATQAKHDLYGAFLLPGYTFAFLTKLQKPQRPRNQAKGATTAADSMILGEELWGAPSALETMDVTQIASQPLQRTHATQRTVGALVRATQQEDEIPATAVENLSVVLQGALSGLRPQEQNIFLKSEWAECDVLFPEGPTHDAFLALLLTLIRTVDVVAWRFGEAQGVGWLWPLLTVAEVPSSHFRLRMLILRLLVLRAHLLPAFLHARHARVFRFVVNTMTHVRFGAEKRFHYLFRDAVRQLFVPRLGTAVRPAMECSCEAEKLFRQMQLLAPHRENYWQEAHMSLMRLFVAHSSGSQYLPFEPLSNIAAYSCGVVGLLMKRFPAHARAREGECCSQIERGPDNDRQVLCAEQLLRQCPWALCDGGSRRRLFSGVR